MSACRAPAGLGLRPPPCCCRGLPGHAARGASPAPAPPPRSESEMLAPHRLRGSTHTSPRGGRLATPRPVTQLGRPGPLHCFTVSVTLTASDTFHLLACRSPPSPHRAQDLGGQQTWSAVLGAAASHAHGCLPATLQRPDDHSRELVYRHQQAAAKQVPEDVTELLNYGWTSGHAGGHCK